VSRQVDLLSFKFEDLSTKVQVLDDDLTHKAKRLSESLANRKGGDGSTELVSVETSPVEEIEIGKSDMMDSVSMSSQVVINPVPSASLQPVIQYVYPPDVRDFKPPPPALRKPRLKKVNQDGPGPEVTRLDLKKYDALFTKVDDIESMLDDFGHQLELLSKKHSTMEENKADKEALSEISAQFKIALGEVANRIATMRKVVNSKISSQEFQQLKSAIFREPEPPGPTSAGSELVKCIVCGTHRTCVTGAVEDPVITRKLYPKPSGLPEDTTCFVYGDHGELYFGRSPSGNPILAQTASASKSGHQP
jgi:uncharacterized protein YoxC